MRNLGIVLLSTLLIAACGKAPPESAEDVRMASPEPEVAVQPAPVYAPFSEAHVRSVVMGAHRSEENKARDRYRNPEETLKFFGLMPGSTVIEINPGAGWYTEILAPIMKGRGQYIAAVIDPATPDMPDYVARLAEMIDEKFAQDQNNYGHAKVHHYNPAAPVLGEPESADMVLTFRNVHGWVNGDTAEAMFAAFYSVLRSGGTLGVVQHRAAEGADDQETARQGYVTEAKVIQLAENAGFRLAESSEINANPRDTRDHPNGVWSLPPNLRVDEDREKYQAIGESDRMTLRFIKD